MKNNLNKIVGTITLLFFTTLLFGQDVHFSQFNQTPLHVNPAFAGAINGDYRAIANYRTQWKNVPASYSTLMGSYDMAIMENKLYTGFVGVGINVFTDKAGDSDLKTSQMNLSVSSNLTISERQYFATGLQIGYGTKSINRSGMTWGNQYGINGYNSSTTSGETFVDGQYGFADIGAGIVWFYTSSDRAKTVGQDNFKINIGVSAFHLNKPKNSFFNDGTERLKTKFVLTSNAKYELASAPVSIMPGILLSSQGSQKELVIGSGIKYQINDNTKYTGLVSESAFFAGVWTRVNDAVIFTTGFLYSGIQIGLSYDINVSGLKVASKGRGGFEMSLSYRGTIETGKTRQSKVKFL